MGEEDIEGSKGQLSATLAQMGERLSLFSLLRADQEVNLNNRQPRWSSPCSIPAWLHLLLMWLILVT